MNRMLAIAALLAAGCSGVNEDRPGCARSADCPAGQYCASTADGAVCWPDAQPPEVSAVAVTCGPPCLRDGTLRVEATVADDHEVAEVSVALDLEPSRAVPMARSGARWVAQVPLATWPFPAFERAVVATVTARDGARNASAAAPAAPQTVTRLRWTYEAGVPMTSPAVLADGTAVVGLSATSGQVVAISSSGVKAWEATVGNRFLASAPAAAVDRIWVASSGGAIFNIGLDGTPGASACAANELLSGPPSIVDERAAVGALSGVLALASLDGACNQIATSGAVEASAVTSESGHLLISAGNNLMSYSVLTNGALRPDWTGISPAPLPPALGDAVKAALAIDHGGNTWAVAQNGTVSQTTPDAINTVVATLPAGSSGPIVLSDGDVVVGGAAGSLVRIALGGVPAWSESEHLNGSPTIPMALGGAFPTLVAPTSTGYLFAIAASDGRVAWSGKLSPTGEALQPANVHGVPGAPTATAYVAGADGTLYAVIVDGQLDTAAPWPKAFHDPRNTGNAGTLP